MLASARPAGRCARCGRLSARGNLLPGRSARALSVSAPRSVGNRSREGFKEAATGWVHITRFQVKGPRTRRLVIYMQT